MTELLNKIPVGTDVTFTTFSSNSKVVYSGVVDNKTSFVVDSILSKVKLGGGTNVYEGLDKSVKSLIPVGKDSAQIVLISDGNFTVTNKIEDVVREEFVDHGRRLTVIHIDSKAKDSERLLPYETTFIHVSPSELSNAVYQVFRKKSFGAVSCGCEDTYSEVMNYHFVVDYSGSMAFHKGRARKALSHLYEQVPDNAVVSITAFSNNASELYVGNKSDLPNESLEGLLDAHKIGGGTNPTPGVKHGLGITKRMAESRFSHLILVTDLRADNLNELVSMKNKVSQVFEEVDLTFSTLTVDLQAHLDLMVSGRTQFDVTSGILRDVSKAKFEKDLFETNYSSCDYSTQPYHYNPFGDLAKDGAKKTLKFILNELMKGGGVSMGL
jgi:Mg-chelatase subunit ChlD